MDEDAGEPPLCSLQGNVAGLGMAAGASGRAGTAPRASWRAGVARAAPTSAEAVGRQWLLSSGLPETWRGAVVLVRGYRSRLGPTLRAAEGLDKLGEQARGVAAWARHMQNARSGRAQSTRTRCSAKCQRGLESVGEAGN